MKNSNQVRVDKLSDLVYKNGQAGVTKASVTIVFDNTDTKLSPVGYEHCKEIAVTRQVVVGGRNKHMINGRTVRSNQVHNLFHSVQLDVNNPHFLIMQGRIVKMMNMKPLEVLGLIEEAGGTRMFERKKEASLKIIQKKERKVEEINKIIKDEISPTLEKLQKDRAAYREYTENQMHIERARRQSVAYVLVVFLFHFNIKSPHNYVTQVRVLRKETFSGNEQEGEHDPKGKDRDTGAQGEGETGRVQGAW